MYMVCSWFRLTTYLEFCNKPLLRSVLSVRKLLDRCKYGFFCYQIEKTEDWAFVYLV